MDSSNVSASGRLQRMAVNNLACGAIYMCGNVRFNHFGTISNREERYTALVVHVFLLKDAVVHFHIRQGLLWSALS